mmetsp:Transcript_2204/g.3880  ORF Transcript_2204/g.3880 Transcript_2204/m.3880 type:complete len:157 (-) Transcript_2204:1975-2445(-)
MVKLFEDIFDLKEIDMLPDPKHSGKKIREKKFDKVSRIVAQSESYGTEVTLDMNTEIYPMKEGTKFELVLADSLQPALGGNPNIQYNFLSSGSLLDDYEYGMHGKVFKYAEENGKAIVYVSYGGLLMALKGDVQALRAKTFEPDTPIYLLIKHVVI